MPEATALQAAETFRAKLLARERQAAVRLVRAYGAVYQRLQTQIDGLTAQLDAMQAAGQEISVAAIGRLDRMKNLKRQIAEEVQRYAAVVESEIDAGALESIRAGLRDAETLAQASLPGLEAIDVQIMARWQRLNPDVVSSLLGFLEPESPLRTALRERFGDAMADLVGEKLIEGIALGYNPRKVHRIVRQSLGQGLTWSLTSVRTAQLYAYREATRAAYLANQEIVPRWQWRCTRDERTCMSCIAKDGSIHPVTEPLNDHHNGRCVAIPVTVTYRELGFDVDEAEAVLEEDAIGWFESLPEARQRKQMGAEFYQAWKAGRFELADFPTTYSDKVYGEMTRAATLGELTDATAAA